MKKIFKKFFEIGAIIAVGICIIFNIWDYIYIPANWTVACIVTGAISMVLYIISLVLHDEEQ